VIAIFVYDHDLTN